MSPLKIIPPKTEQPNLDKFLKLTEEAVEIFRSQSTVVDLSAGKTLFVGDIHGDLDSAKTALKIAEKYEADNLLFMGDYVDRGLQQLETLEFVLKLAIMSPEKIVVLKGNHESESVNKQYGFVDVVYFSFPYENEAERVLKACYQVYDYLPIVATTPFSIALHGGVPEKSNLSEIRDIPKPYSIINSFDEERKERLNRILTEILWNDPSEDLHTSFGPSFRGKTPKTFGKKPLIEFLEKASKKRLFRSHEASRGSYDFLWENRLIYIFSSEPYSPLKPRIHEAVYALEEENGSVKIINSSLKIIADLEPIE